MIRKGGIAVIWHPLLGDTDKLDDDEEPLTQGAIGPSETAAPKGSLLGRQWEEPALPPPLPKPRTKPKPTRLLISRLLRALAKAIDGTDR